MDLTSDFESIIMHPLHVLLTLSATIIRMNTVFKETSAMADFSPCDVVRDEELGPDTLRVTVWRHTQTFVKHENEVDVIMYARRLLRK